MVGYFGIDGGGVFLGGVGGYFVLCVENDLIFVVVGNLEKVCLDK